MFAPEQAAIRSDTKRIADEIDALSKTVDVPIQAMQSEGVQGIAQGLAPMQTTTGTGSVAYGIAKDLRLQQLRLNLYYQQNLQQSNVIFKIATFASLAGLAVLLAGVLLALFTSVTAGLLAALSGVVVEALSGTVFFVYRSTLNETHRFVDQLSDLQNNLLAISQSESVSGVKRDELKGKIVEALLTQARESKA